MLLFEASYVLCMKNQNLVELISVLGFMGKILFWAIYFADINAGGFKYSVLSVRVDVSSGGGSTGPISGAQTGKILLQNKRIYYQLTINDLYLEAKQNSYHILKIKTDFPKFF